MVVPSAKSKPCVWHVMEFTCGVRDFTVQHGAVTMTKICRRCEGFQTRDIWWWLKKEPVWIVVCIRRDGVCSCIVCDVWFHLVVCCPEQFQHFCFFTIVCPKLDRKSQEAPPPHSEKCSAWAPAEAYRSRKTTCSVVSLKTVGGPKTPPVFSNTTEGSASQRHRRNGQSSLHQTLWKPPHGKRDFQRARLNMCCGSYVCSCDCCCCLLPFGMRVILQRPHLAWK